MTDKNTMPDVSIVGCDNYSEETVKAAYDELFASLDALSWVKSGMTVGIKAVEHFAVSTFITERE